MTKKLDLKTVLTQKLAENNLRHAAAEQETNFNSGRQHLMIKVDEIDPNPYQPRRIFPHNELEKLALSISESGLIQPITVRRVNAHYQIVAGERRWRAFQLLGKPSIECLVSDISDAEMAILALAENMDREDLSDYEIGVALRNIENLFPTKKKLAESLGIHREDMYRYFAFEDLPEFIRNDLNKNPRLMARSAANDLKRVLKILEGEPHLETCLYEAWSELIQGNLEQTKLPTYINRRVKNLKENIEDDLKHTHNLLRLGKKVGFITWGERHVIVKLQANAINPSQETQLKEFLDGLLES